MSTPGLAVEGLSLRLGSFALDRVALRLEAGEVLAILGPNGAGKSVTLEAIAGFHRLREGRVAIAGEEVTWLPPERRRIGLMPQNFALFPHLTVADNVALPLRIAARAAGQGGAASSLRQSVEALLKRFGILPLGGRYPQFLSPGERQRAALARALAARPRLFLFDEPFSAMDAYARQGLRVELGQFLRGAAIPAVFVTHDPHEAAMLAGRVAVMRDGRIVQQGLAEAVFRAPADVATAQFLGVENIIGARLAVGDGTVCRVSVGGAMLRTGAGNRNMPAGGDTVACIRAEDVALRPAAIVEPTVGSNRLPAMVCGVSGAGPLVTVTLDCGFPLVSRVLAREARALGLAPGAAVTAEIADDAIHLIA